MNRTSINRGNPQILKILLSLILTLLALSSFAQNMKLSKKEKQQLSTFMTNFSEVSLPNFDQKHPLTQTQLLKFAIAHKQYQEWMISLGIEPGHQIDRPGQTKVLTKEYIMGVIKRCFGVTLNWSSLPKNLVTKKALTIRYGGERIEGTYWTVAKSLTKIGDLYKLTGEFWVTNTGDQDYPDGTVEAMLKKTPSGWNLVAYTERRTKH